jgi:acyl-coenzyme A thioesterase PaaI-like protein
MSNTGSDNQSDLRGGFLTHWEASSMAATTGAWKEKRRLAAAMREVIGRLVESDAPEEELARAADALERYARQLKTHPKGRRYEGLAESSLSAGAPSFFDMSPLIGLANPLAPPVSMEADREKGQVRATVTFGAAYEGPPGCVHGGWVAAAFDEVLGFANSLSGNPGMTGTLTVRYRNPTPLHTPLRFEATLDRVEGRKKFTSSQLYAGDLLTAEAEGIFVSVDPSRFQSLLAARAKRDGA